MVGLVGREHLGKDTLDSQFTRDRLSRPTIVACQHHNLDVGSPETLDSDSRTLANGISNSDDSSQFTIEGDIWRYVNPMTAIGPGSVDAARAKIETALESDFQRLFINT